MNAPLTFNILYTPGTVKYLRLFVFSLLKHTPCAFRLVANGCTSEEAQLLQALCDQDLRLEYLALPFPGIAEHSQALSHLQSQERSDYFAYIDSDVLATGDFYAEIAPLLADCAAVFSASPLWMRAEDAIMQDRFQGVAGRYSRTEAGLCLGSTSFGIYHNSILNRFFKTSGIRFERYTWDTIPPQFQARLERIGMKKARFDTGKVLNLLLQEQGERMVFVPGETLIHLGGVSAQVKRASEGKQRSLLSIVLDQLWRRFKDRLKDLAGMEAEKSSAPKTSLAEQKTRLFLRSTKPASSAYFYQLLVSLFEDRPLPARPSMGDAQVEARIAAATGEICTLYQEFAPQMVNG